MEKGTTVVSGNYSGSLITEEINDRIGMSWGAEVYYIEHGMIERFLDATGSAGVMINHERNPETESGCYKTVPPTFLMALPLQEQIDWMKSVDCPLKTVVNGGNEFELLGEIAEGDTITVTGSLCSVEEKRGTRGAMLIFTMDREYANQHDALVARGKCTYIRM